MLEFANRPPEGPEDVNLSESGKRLLLDALDWDRKSLHAFGEAACSEIVDALGSAVDVERSRALSDRVTDEATTLLGRDQAMRFAMSMNINISNFAAMARLERRSVV